MRKKPIAIFIILLANIVLLALAVVPHHHHEHAICFIGNHCSHDTDCHHDSQAPSEAPTHHHNSSGCAINDWILIKATPHQHEYNEYCAACVDTLLVALIPGLPEIPVPQTGLLFKPQSFTITYLLIHISQNHGLRAPPFC